MATKMSPSSPPEARTPAASAVCAPCCPPPPPPPPFPRGGVGRPGALWVYAAMAIAPRAFHSGSTMEGVPLRQGGAQPGFVYKNQIAMGGVWVGGSSAGWVGLKLWTPPLL